MLLSIIIIVPYLKMILAQCHISYTPMCCRVISRYISTYRRCFAVVVPAVVTTTQPETTTGLCCMHFLCCYWGTLLYGI